MNEAASNELFLLSPSHRGIGHEMSEAAAKSSFLAAAVDLDAVLDDLERVEEEQQQQLAAAKIILGNGENGERHDDNDDNGQTTTVMDVARENDKSFKNLDL